MGWGFVKGVQGLRDNQAQRGVGFEKRRVRENRRVQHGEREGVAV